MSIDQIAVSVLTTIIAVGLMLIGYETNWFNGFSHAVLAGNKVLAVGLMAVSVATVSTVGVIGIAPLMY